MLYCLKARSVLTKNFCTVCHMLIKTNKQTKKRFHYVYVLVDENITASSLLNENPDYSDPKTNNPRISITKLANISLLAIKNFLSFTSHTAALLTHSHWEYIQLSVGLLSSCWLQCGHFQSGTLEGNLLFLVTEIPTSGQNFQFVRISLFFFC